MQSASRIEIENALPDMLPRLWRFALSLTRNRQCAEDLLQSACVRLLEKSDAYTPGTQVDRWAFIVTMNIWRTELRRRRRDSTIDFEALETIVDWRDVSPEEGAFSRQVLNAIDRLPPEQSAAVVLVYGEGFTYREAADILDVPIGTIMSRLFSARQALNGLRR